MAGEDRVTSVYISLRESLARAVKGIVPPKEIEDIVQETYVRACQAGHRDEIRTPRSFLFKTARNLALDYAKRAESRLAISVEDEQEFGLGETQRAANETFDQVASNEEFSQFCEAVRRLPVQCRRAFVLKKVYGYTQREIATELNISESTVEKHIAQGIKRCTYFMMQLDSKVWSMDRARRSGSTPKAHGSRKGDRS
jgi:RNA polymerase sigma-70 factor (ECF subfamily)